MPAAIALNKGCDIPTQYAQVTQHIERMLSQKEGQGTTKADDSDEPLFLYVSGFGGTGKSYLIKALQGFLWVMKNICDKPADIALTAPTGLAAANIDGLTLHSLFNIARPRRRNGSEMFCTPQWRSL